MSDFVSRTEYDALAKQFQQALQDIAYLKGRWEQWEKDHANEDGSESDDESGSESDDESGSESDDESGSESDDESESDDDDGPSWDVISWECWDHQDGVQKNDLQEKCKCGKWMCKCTIVHRAETKQCSTCKRYKPDKRRKMVATPTKTWECCDQENEPTDKCECGKWWCKCEIVHRAKTKQCSRCRLYKPDKRRRTEKENENEQ